MVGGGHNGLVCAAYLAKSGLSVAVVEQKRVVGGCVVTEEATPGWKINTYSFEHYVIQNTPIISDLGLDRFGLRYYDVNPAVFSPFKDGTMMLFFRDVAKTTAHIASFSVRDARAYERFHEKWSKVSRALGKAALDRPASLEEIVDRSDEFSGDYERKEVLEEAGLPASKILEETFETENLRSPIAFLGPAAVGQSPAATGTGWLLAWHIGAEKLARPSGGSGQLSVALQRALEHYGGIVITGEKVSRIMITDGKVAGVETNTGRKIESRIVASNADPEQTLSALLQDPDENLPPSDRRRIASIKVSPGFTFKADYLLNRLPRYSCMPGLEGVASEGHRAATFIAPSVQSLSDAYDEFVAGKNPERPGLMVAIHSTTDPSLAPNGKHSLVLETRYTPYRIRNSPDWTESRAMDEAERLLSIYSEYCPGVESAVEATRAMSPQDMERDVMIPKGNFMHADMVFDQMFDRRPSKGLLDGYSFRNIPGLFLCGSGAFPGGAVSGLPGRNAAMQILSELTQ